MNSPENQKMSLVVEAITCIRADRVLFEGLNFEIIDNQVMLLEGENGSGKTSLLRILCGFREPDRGEIYWCGEPLGHQYYAQMVYIGHRDGVKNELTVQENLLISAALGFYNNISIEQALMKLGLQGFNDVLVQSLSAGQKRRLSLARLLITENKLWILDEPFTSLDKYGIAVVEKLIIEHVNSGGMVILTSHHDVKFQDVKPLKINLS